MHLTTSAACIMLYTVTLVVSRLLSPAVAPATYARLAEMPGQRGYWDSSVASTLNGIANTLLACRVVWRHPTLVSSADAFVVTPESTMLVVVFLTWCAFDLAQLVFYWRHWEGRAGMLVHHGCAIVAWALYLEGGYGHALSLVGVVCEATNPFMNMRYFLSTAGLKRSNLCTSHRIQHAALPRHGRIIGRRFPCQAPRHSLRARHVGVWARAARRYGQRHRLLRLMAAGERLHRLQTHIYEEKGGPRAGEVHFS